MDAMEVMKQQRDSYLHEVARLNAEINGLLGQNHANYTSKWHFAITNMVLIVLLILITDATSSLLSGLDRTIGWITARWWCWPLVFLFWVRIAFYARTIFMMWWHRR